MRQLNITNTPTPNVKEIQTRMDETEAWKIDNEEQEALVQQIRNGDEAAIPKLIKGMEYLIWSMVMNVCGYNPHKNIDELFEAGKIGLEKLAEQEINNTSRERFFRFGTWWIRQEMLKVIMEK